MASSIKNRTLALAGIFQSAALVHQLAITGQAEEDATLNSIESLFKIDAEDVPAVFSGIGGNYFPEWVAGFTRNQWQVYSRMGGRFAPESTGWNQDPI